MCTISSAVRAHRPHSSTVWTSVVSSTKGVPIRQVGGRVRDTMVDSWRRLDKEGLCSLSLYEAVIVLIEECKVTVANSKALQETVDASTGSSGGGGTAYGAIGGGDGDNRHWRDASKHTVVPQNVSDSY